MRTLIPAHLHEDWVHLPGAAGEGGSRGEDRVLAPSPPNTMCGDNTGVEPTTTTIHEVLQGGIQETQAHCATSRKRMRGPSRSTLVLNTLSTVCEGTPDPSLPRTELVKDTPDSTSTAPCLTHSARRKILVHSCGGRWGEDTGVESPGTQKMCSCAGNGKTPLDPVCGE